MDVSVDFTTRENTVVVLTGAIVAQSPLLVRACPACAAKAGLSKWDAADVLERAVKDGRAKVATS